METEEDEFGRRDRYLLGIIQRLLGREIDVKLGGRLKSSGCIASPNNSRSGLFGILCVRRM